MIFHLPLFPPSIEAYGNAQNWNLTWALRSEKTSTKEKIPLLHQEGLVGITKEENRVGSMISGRGSSERKYLKMRERELGSCKQLIMAGARPEVL